MNNNYTLNQLDRIRSVQQNLNECLFNLQHPEKKQQVKILINKINALITDLSGDMPMMTVKEKTISRVGRSSGLRRNSRKQHMDNTNNNKNISDFNVFAHSNMNNPSLVEKRRQELKIPKQKANFIMNNTQNNTNNAQIAILVSKFTPLYHEKFENKTFSNSDHLIDAIKLDLHNQSSVPSEYRNIVAQKIANELQFQDI
jgi:hypothetical protein